MNPTFPFRCRVFSTKRNREYGTLSGEQHYGLSGKKGTTKSSLSKDKTNTHTHWRNPTIYTAVAELLLMTGRECDFT